MGHALAKPESQSIEPQNGSKKAASMTTKKNEQLPLSGETLSRNELDDSTRSSFGLLGELHGDLKSILELLEKHDVRDFRVEKGSERIALRRGPESVYNPGTYSSAGSAPRMTQPAETAQFSNGGLAYNSAPQSHPVDNVLTSTAPSAPVVVPNKAYREVTSPMVGTFYRRPAVDAEPYVEVGDMVKKGDVLCIVEAMKLMNEIECEISGKIVEVCLDDTQMVEYGEVLFRIEPA